MNASYVAPPVKETRHNSRTGSFAFPIAARSHRASIRSFELDRVSLARCDSRLGAAADDASDRLLHSETTELEYPYTRRFPAQRRFTRVPFSDTRACSHFRGLRLVPTHSASRGVPPFRPKTKERASRSSGPLGASETGENRVSRRDPHFGDRRCETCGVDSSARPNRATTSDIPVASSVCSLRIAMRFDGRTRRPPRSVPRGPRERRALLRPEMPSIVRSFSATARAEARTNRGAFVETWRSRDEDCHASNEPSPFCLVRPLRLRARVSPLVTRPPSTRLLLRTSFRPVRYRGRASLSPKTTYRLLQYDDVRAPAAGRLILDRGERRRALHLRSPFALSCETTRATSHEAWRASEDARASWTGRPERRFDRLSTMRSPSSNRPRTPLSCVRGA